MRRPTRRIRQLLVASAALGLVYLGGPALLLLWTLAGLAPFLIRARWRWRPTALLLLPLLFVGSSFLHGVMTYAAGTAHFEAGPRRTDIDNLDRSTRVRGSEPHGPNAAYQEVTAETNDEAIRWMGRLFGPMPGAYKGPYPTEAETSAILSLTGEDVSLAALFSGTFLLQGEPVFLGRSLTLDLLLQSGRAKEVWGARVEHELLLLHFERPPPSDDAPSSYFDGAGGSGEPSTTWLVDLKGQRVVARYHTFHLDTRRAVDTPDLDLLENGP